VKMPFFKRLGSRVSSEGRNGQSTGFLEKFKKKGFQSSRVTEKAYVSRDLFPERQTNVFAPKERQ